jgi:hypothetical protein
LFEKYLYSIRKILNVCVPRQKRTLPKEFEICYEYFCSANLCSEICNRKEMIYWLCNNLEHCKRYDTPKNNKLDEVIQAFDTFIKAKQLEDFLNNHEKDLENLCNMRSKRLYKQGSHPSKFMFLFVVIGFDLIKHHDLCNSLLQAS